MESGEKFSLKESSVKQEFDISEKLTSEDINKIEKYRQTRRTSVLTILFTDIVGYTGFTYDAGEKASGKYRHIHDEIIINQIKKDGHGEIVKQIGDSFMIVFSDPTIAVKQALKIQELFKINEGNLTHKGYQLKIRSGLHMGQVSVEDNILPDVFGTHVNLAARVMSLAQGGQVLVSGSVWENASGWLKDEQVKEVQSIHYGKIHLKGIGTETDIYEFYNDNTGKIGIPYKLKKKRRNRIVGMYSLIALILVILTSSLFLFLSNDTNNTSFNFVHAGKLIIADLDSYNKTIEEAKLVEWQIQFPKYDEFPLIVIDPLKLSEINRHYKELVKTNFITEFEIETEEQIKQEYAKIGLMVPEDFDDDTIISRQLHSIRDKSKLFNSVYIFSPHIYKYQDEEKYYLIVESRLKEYEIFDAEGKFKTNTNISGMHTTIISDFDSVALILYDVITEKISSHKKNIYAKGKIFSINKDEVLIDFDFDNYKKIPPPGVILQVRRNYDGGYWEAADSGVIRRLHDLDNIRKYYKTPEEWVKNIDTSENYLWSYKEYSDLKDSVLRYKAPSGFNIYLQIDLKIIDVYDTTALAKIHFKKFPWLVLEAGDLVHLK